MTQYEKKPEISWKKVAGTTGPIPKPRHGHRVFNVNELMIIIGGGCDGILNETSVYNTVTNVWQSPDFKGDIPAGRAAFGLATDGQKVYIFGGMLEYGIYSNELYELQINKWEWKKLSPTAPTAGEYPCPRIGHSFTLIGKRIFMFGGLSNNFPFYHNDLYILNINKQGVFTWEIPVTYGEGPSPRESHTAVSFYDDIKQKHYLVIYGGMYTNRLGDTWFLDTDSMKWEYPKLNGVIPLPRSLHTATLIGSKMYIFGGWTPTPFSARREAEWRCTNTLGCLNLKTLTWESQILRENHKDSPKARTGHSAIAIGGRMYIWSGRDGYRRAWDLSNPTRVPQVCWNDMWYLETLVPQKPNKIRLNKATDNSLELAWNPVHGVSHYLLQIQKIDRVMVPIGKVGPQSMIQSNLIVRKPLDVPPKIPIPQMDVVPAMTKPIGVKIIKQEIISPACFSPPKHIIVNPKSESSQMPKSIIIVKPSTSFPVVKKMRLGSFKFTDKDGTPVNTSPSTSKFRVIDNFKQPILQRDRTLVHQKRLNDNKASSSTNIELPNNNQYDYESDNIDQLDGASDPEIKIVSNDGDDNNNENEELGQNEQAEEKESSNVLSPKKEIKMEEDKSADEIVDKWDTIDFLDDCRDIALSYISYDDWNMSKIVDLTSDNIPDLSKYKRQALKAGMCYGFRVAGINSLGIGEFSETVEFRTYTSSSVTTAPHTIRVCRIKNGVRITWMPPSNAPENDILEYIVLMAIKEDVTGDNKRYQFENIYCGKNTQCFVKYTTIQKAHVDNDSDRPKIIFRISAANSDNLHGPATQVKWIQDQPLFPKMENMDTEVNNNIPESSRNRSINE